MRWLTDFVRNTTEQSKLAYSYDYYDYGNSYPRKKLPKNFDVQAYRKWFEGPWDRALAPDEQKKLEEAKTKWFVSCPPSNPRSKMQIYDLMGSPWKGGVLGAGAGGLGGALLGASSTLRGSLLYGRDFNPTAPLIGAGVGALLCGVGNYFARRSDNKSYEEKIRNSPPGLPAYYATAFPTVNYRHPDEVENGQEPLKKKADREDNITAIYASLAGLGTSLLAQKVISNQLQKTLHKATDTKDDQYIEGLAKSVGHKNMPILRQPKMDNAAYIEPAHPSLLRQAGFFLPRDLSVHRAIRDKGAVVYDPGTFNKPAILAHELGHASIRLQPWYSPSRWNQSLFRPLGDSINAYGTVAGAVAGALTGNPLIGAGIGGGVGLLTGAPTLLNEWQASSRAKEFMKNGPPLNKEELDHGGKILNKAWQTYLAGALVPGLAAGAVGGGLGLLNKQH